MPEVTKKESIKAFTHSKEVEVFLVTKDNAEGKPETFYKVNGELLSHKEFSKLYFIDGK